MKYRDTPCNIKGLIDDAFGHIPKSKNPTIKHILKTIEQHAENYEKQGYTIHARNIWHAANEIRKCYNKGENQ